MALGNSIASCSDGRTDGRGKQMHICLSHYVKCAPLFANQTVLRQCGKRDIQSVEGRREGGREKKCAPGQPELAHLSLVGVGVGGRRWGGLEGGVTTGDMQAVVSKYVTERRGRAVVLLGQLASFNGRKLSSPPLPFPPLSRLFFFPLDPLLSSDTAAEEGRRLGDREHPSQWTSKLSHFEINPLREDQKCHIEMSHT